VTFSFRFLGLTPPGCARSALPQQARERIAEAASAGIPVVPVDQVEQVALDNGLSQEHASAVAGDYGEAQLDGLKLLGLPAAEAGATR
jgi:hypothetical protein